MAGAGALDQGARSTGEQIAGGVGTLFDFRVKPAARDFMEVVQKLGGRHMTLRLYVTATFLRENSPVHRQKA
jgi:hypothetical protein